MMDSRHSKILKLLSVATCMVFLTVDLLYAVDSRVFSLRVPEEYGKVSERWKGESADPPVVHIQDIHGNLEAQQNISKILDFFENEKDYKDSSIGLEGVTDQVDFSDFRLYPFRDARREVTWDYVKKGYFSGAEAYSIISDNPLKLYGLEDPEKFQDNLKVFSNLHKHQKEYQTLLEQLFQSLRSEQKRLYPDELLQMERWRLSLERPSESLSVLFMKFLEAARRWSVDTKAYPQIALLEEILALFRRQQNPEKNLREVKELVRQIATEQVDFLLKQQIQKLDKERRLKKIREVDYLRWLLREANRLQVDVLTLPLSLKIHEKLLLLDSIRLLKEIRAFVFALQQATTNRLEVKRLIQLTQYFLLLKDLVQMRATPDEAKQYQALKRGFPYKRIKLCLRNSFHPPSTSFSW